MTETKQSGPTLNAIGTFEFDSFCDEHPDFSNMRAVDCVLKQLSEKLESNNSFKNIYILDGRTGSGKSTLFIAELFKKFNKKVLIAEPRIVLTRNNTFDIIQRNPTFSLGTNIGFKNSTESQVPVNEHSVTFMTTQLLVNQLQTFYQFFTTITEKMFIIIDEAHLLDIQTLDLLREVKRFIDKHGSERLCPLFILQSATLRINEVVRYYFPTTFNEFRKGWHNIGHVKGLSNFKVTERFVPSNTMQNLIEMENSKVSPPIIIASYYLKDQEKYYGPVKIDTSELKGISDNLRGGAEENLLTKIINTKRTLRKSSYQIFEEAFEDPFEDYILSDSPSEDKIKGAAFIDESPDHFKNVRPEPHDTKRFVHLIFLPYVRGILEFGTVIMNTLNRINFPTYLIKAGENMDIVNEWRKRNPCRRLLIIPVSRNYSRASDTLIDGNDHPFDEHLESHLYVATNVIETGKTIKNLNYALDCGFDTCSCFNPLMFNINKYRNVIRQVPESRAKAIQRLGRVGRECPGDFLHFMTEETYKKLDDYEPPETINAYCISKQLLDIAWMSLWKQYDFEASNIYMIKFTTDILINSCSDLIRAGFLSPFSEIIDFGVVSYSADFKFFYLMKYLHYIKHIPIKEAITTAAINERDQNVYLCIDYRNYQFKNIEELDEERLTLDVVLMLKKANNVYMRVKYDISYIMIKDLNLKK